MKAEHECGKIAIIGMGPRGLGALEALAAKWPNTKASLTVDVFDPFPAVGAGPNFNPDESPLCLLNIPMRDVAIEGPAFSRCGGFAEWLDDAPGPDTFAARRDLGRYLEARLSDLIDLGLLEINLLSLCVEAVEPADDGGWMLRVDGASRGPYADVLLTVGQPTVKPDEQLAAWQDHARQSGATLMQAYPARRLSAAAGDWSGQTVAIRGLALSAFDILRVLTVGLGGRFAEGHYHASGFEPALILPFSLDGKPPFPKPATEALDHRFHPLPAETRLFEAAISSAVDATPDEVKRLVNDALAPVILRVMREADQAPEQDWVSDWLETEWSSPGNQETGDAREILQLGISMADGSCPPTIGYTVGQVWRKWQNQLRGSYNSAQRDPDAARVLVSFDEGLKRYSYGPPLSSSLELLALLDCGLVELDHSADPHIEMTQTGWILQSGSWSRPASVMVDGVMASPDLSAIVADPVARLVADGRITKIQDGLSAQTTSNGSLIDESGQIVPGLCLLGRLALGSIIAADSLHDCFGQSTDRWAEGVIQRLA